MERWRPAGLFVFSSSLLHFIGRGFAGNVKK